MEGEREALKTQARDAENNNTKLQEVIIDKDEKIE